MVTGGKQMDNSSIKKEATRIAKELVKIGKSDKSLDEIFHSLLKKEFEKYDMKVLLYTSDALIDEKYSIENTDPFCLKEIQY